MSVGEANEAAGALARLNPQGVNNLILGCAVLGIGLLIYMDRRDRQEYNAIQLRYNETQNEQMRQVVVGNTNAIQSLSMQVGELKSSVTELRRTVGAAKDKLPGGDDDSAGVEGEDEIDVAAAVGSISGDPAADAGDFDGVVVVGGAGVVAREHHNNGPAICNRPMNLVFSDGVLFG